MPIEENKKLVRRYFKDAPRNPDVCDEIFAPRILFHAIHHSSISPQTMASDPLSEKVVYDSLKETWSPDWGISIDEMIAEGNRVVVQWTFRGKHISEYAGLPPTNKQVRYSGINIFRIENNRIAEVWDISDRLWLWQQLGVLPEVKDNIVTVRSRIEAENFNKRTIRQNNIIVEEKKAKSRIGKLSKMCVLSYKNCLRLHMDSIVLFKKGSYATAYAISIIALEEMGKYMYLSDGLFYNWFSSDSDEKIMDKVLADIYDHQIKQRIFVNLDFHDNYSKDLKSLIKQGFDVESLLRETKDNFEEKLKEEKWGKLFPNTKKLYSRIETLEKEKQKSLYVGFPKRGRTADLGKNIISPFRTSKEKVERQITLLNDHLLSDALGVMKGLGGLDFEELEDMVTPAYISKLHKSWPIITKRNRSRLLAWLKMPNDKIE